MCAAEERLDALEGEVAAMQFAAGRSIAEIAAQCERDVAWVEAAVRRALLQSIPQRAGGLKPARAEVRAERDEEQMRLDGLQPSLEL